MADPTVTFGLDLTGSGTYTTIPGVVSAVITRGRQRELDRFQEGRIELVVRNETRDLDPANTAGAYYPDLKPMRRLRLRANYSAVNYDQFVGYVDRWTQDPAGPHDATVRVEATDYFKVLARTQLPPSAYAAEVMADHPTSWWRLGEPDDQPIAFDAAPPGNHLTYLGSPARNEQNLVSRDPNGSVFFEHTNINRAERQGGPRLLGGYPHTIEFVLRIAAQEDSSQRFVLALELTAGNSIAVDVGQAPYAGRLRWSASGDNGATGQGFVSNIRVDDGQTHHVAIVATTVSNVTIYIDGVADTTHPVATASPAIGATQAYVALGNVSDRSQGAGLFGLNGWLADVALYDGTTLSAARVAAHAGARSTPWDGETPGSRAARIAAIADRSWFLENNPLAPATDLDTGSSTLQSATLGMTALEHLQTTADSDFGAVFIEADGTLRLVGRQALINQASQATLTDAHGSDPSISSLAPQYGDDLIRNDVHISRADGVSQNAQDPDSIDAYLTQSFSMEGLYHDSDELSRDAAEFLVSEYSEPLQRISGLTVRPRGDPDTLFPVVLGLDLGDVVTVEYTPVGIGSPISQRSVIEGIEHRIGPKTWETRWSLSPAYAGDFLELDRVTGPGLDFERLYF